MHFSIRLFAAAIGTMGLFSQNPLADPFSGTFQNEQMKLELARRGADYSGSIEMDGQTLPLKAKAGAGKLVGTFDAKGQAYSFEAVRNGTQLSLTTDGTTHILEKAAPAVAAAPPAIVGDWIGQAGPVRINADGTATIGDKAQRWTLDGSTIVFAANGETIQIPFVLAGDRWAWTLPTGELVLARSVAGAPDKGVEGSWQGQNGNMQINPDGTAVVAGVQYRYAHAGNRLTLTGPDGTFVATVQRNGDSMTWLVNGKTLTFQRAATTWAVGGGNGILPELIGKWCQEGKACYSLLADGSFQFANDAGTWTAAADSLTLRSKKSGVRTVRLEKRNHPKTGEPMLVMDGEEFATAYQKAPWR